MPKIPWDPMRKWIQRTIRDTAFIHPSKDLTVLMQSPAHYWKDIGKKDYSCLPASNLTLCQIIPWSHQSRAGNMTCSRIKKFWKQHQDGIFTGCPLQQCALAHPQQHCHGWFFFAPCLILTFPMGSISVRSPRFHSSDQSAVDYHSIHLLFLICSAQSGHHRKPWRAVQPVTQGTKEGFDVSLWIRKY